jgi:hypothetical protein
LREALRDEKETMRVADARSYVITVDAERLRRFFRETRLTSEPFWGVVRPRVGCTLSHLALWRRIAEGPDEFAVVYEDDARFLRDENEEDRTALAQFLRRRDEHVLLLGHHPWLFDLRPAAEEGGGSLATGHALDLHAYAIKRTGAAALLEKYEARLRNEWHLALLPLGAIDTLFLVERVCALRPPLFEQTDNSVYAAAAEEHSGQRQRPPAFFFVLYFLNRAWLRSLVAVLVVLAAAAATAVLLLVRFGEAVRAPLKQRMRRGG